MARLNDPSGRREPKHRYTRPFRTAERYVAVSKCESVWEFKLNHCRALFVIDGRKAVGSFSFLSAENPLQAKRLSLASLKYLYDD